MEVKGLAGTSDNTSKEVAVTVSFTQHWSLAKTRLSNWQLKGLICGSWVLTWLATPLFSLPAAPNGVSGLPLHVSLPAPALGAAWYLKSALQYRTGACGWRPVSRAGGACSHGAAGEGGCPQLAVLTVCSPWCCSLHLVQAWTLRGLG